MNDPVRQVLQDIAEAAAQLKDLKFFTPKELPKLDECPFCGGSARLYYESRPDPPACYYVWMVRCTNCGASTKEYPTGNYYGMNATPEDVTKAWNRRPSHED